MTAVWPILYISLTLAAGAAAVGLLPAGLRLEERLAMTPVIGIIGGTAAAVGLSLLFGLNLATVLGGPLLLGLVAAALSLLMGDLRTPWRECWHQATWRRPWFLGVLGGALTALIPVYGHGIFERDGDLLAGYAVVWADWSNHLSRAASFAVAGNPPSLDPLFSGTTLRYPFLPDFHSAMLALTGVGAGITYALPLIVLCMCITLLIVCIGRRLGTTTGAGVIATIICFLGGGLGFVGLAADACTHHGYSSAQCSPSEVVRAPVKAVEVALGTIHDVPGLVAAQPRDYDGLGHRDQPLSNQQWYTPLMAWWLPQTAFVYGFATALTVLVMVLAAAPAAGRQWAVFGAAGLLAGMLPLIHLHSLVALAIVLPLLALQHRRREWLLLAGICGVVAIPRLVQLSLGPHGTVSAGNQFPWLEPGWLWNAAAGSGPLEPTVGGAITALGAMVRLPVTPGWWQFWLLNLGVALPISVVVVLAACCSRGPSRLRPLGVRLLRPFPPRLLRFCLAFMPIFAIANLVIFQSWDWDNTKLFAYWYLAVALLAGALVSHWFTGAARRPWRRIGGRLALPRPSWRPIAATAMLTSMLLTGALVVLRLLPWTPAAYATAGPYTVASGDEHGLAATVAERTSRQDVFLTPGRPNDPILVLAGRTSVMAYYGWLWSYGTDFGTRPEDIRTLYLGCATVPDDACRVNDLLSRYGVSYVEVDDRLQDSGLLETQTDVGWWRSRHLPIVAESEHIVIYDVRRR
ncbi:MAG: hypothetical protein LC685_03585 [Actinobacteria bacterium]|nr:hypothetical protein [Actinomycetota bacterium]